MNINHLFYKPYVNKITVTEQYLFLQCCQSLQQKSYQQQDQDLFKEVLWVSVDQRAAEIQAIKVGDHKRILPLSPARAK